MKNLEEAKANETKEILRKKQEEQDSKKDYTSDSASYFTGQEESDYDAEEDSYSYSKAEDSLGPQTQFSSRSNPNQEFKKPDGQIPKKLFLWSFDEDKKISRSTSFPGALKEMKNDQSSLSEAFVSRAENAQAQQSVNQMGAAIAPDESRDNKFLFSLVKCLTSAFCVCFAEVNKAQQSNLDSPRKYKNDAQHLQETIAAENIQAAVRRHLQSPKNDAAHSQQKFPSDLFLAVKSTIDDIVQEVTEQVINKKEERKIIKEVLDEIIEKAVETAQEQDAIRISQEPKATMLPNSYKSLSSAKEEGCAIT